MEKLPGGTSSFDIRMSREDHALIMRALGLARKNMPLLIDPVDPMNASDISAAGDGFYSFTADDEGRIVVRQKLFPYLDAVVILKKIASLLEDKDLTDSNVNIERLKSIANDLDHVLPEEDVTAAMFPEEYRRLLYASEKE